MTDLHTLASMVEAATGPDRELDRDIMLAAVPCDRAPFRYWAPMNENTGHGVVDVERVYYAPHCAQSVAVPAYTESLDAAMTLVPEGCQWALDSHHNIARVWRYFDTQNGPDHEVYLTEAAAPALSLCSAALRSRAAMGEG
jgi:hypothetical protein